MHEQHPPVLTWFRVYCGLMLVLYALVFIGGIFLVAVADQLETPDQRTQAYVQGIVCAVFGLPLAILFLVPFLLSPSKGAWIFDLVMICLGMTSVCCLPITIPLLIHWLKPETKQYFNVS